uniref:Uncharacterized protein n=1 Tax=Physcomitrium patens TaxID=3218 RepID=A0A7I4D790_PHYPA
MEGKRGSLFKHQNPFESREETGRSGGLGGRNQHRLDDDGADVAASAAKLPGARKLRRPIRTDGRSPARLRACFFRFLPFFARYRFLGELGASNCLVRVLGAIVRIRTESVVGRALSSRACFSVIREPSGDTHQFLIGTDSHVYKFTGTALCLVSVARIIMFQVLLHRLLCSLEIAWFLYLNYVPIFTLGIAFEFHGKVMRESGW